MKKVLIYRYELLPYSQTFIKAQAEALKSWDYMYLTNKITPEISIDPSKIILIPKILRNRFIKDHLGFLHRFFYRRFIHKLKTMNFGLLHAHFGTDAVRVAGVAEDLNIPLVVTLHGTDINVYREIWESGAMGKRHVNYPNELLEIALNDRVHFVAVSYALKNRAIEFGIPSEKVTVCYIGVDTERFTAHRQTAENRDILFVGRMIENKGVKILINAFAKVHSIIPQAKLLLIGDGPEMQSCMQLAQSLMLPVVFLGKLPANKVAEYLNQSRVFCLPSYTIESGASEGLGMVILEAQACGIPVVTSARGGATEAIVDGKTGFAFPEKDEEKLSQYLVKLLQDDLLVERMSINAVAHVRQKFDINRCVEQLECIYDSLIFDRGDK